MGRLRTIGRRSFLIGSVAVAGGVAFGIYKFVETPTNPLVQGAGSFSPNAFIVINQEGVTVVAPKAEMGQGVHTTWAALIAEELDVELSDIRVIHGPPAKAYYNSALFGLALPFTDYKVNNFQQALREFAGNGAKLIGLQLTGGSTSMIDGFARMRHAGASAREVLKEAAAKQLGVSSADLGTQKGHVITPKGDKISYTELAEAASEITPWQVGLRDRSEWRILGKSQPRIDMVGKVTGTAEFGADVRLPGMRFASVRMSPIGGTMVGFNADIAREMAGVVKILDLGHGVAVVATNTWLAMKALDTIDIKWGPSPLPESSDILWGKIEGALDGPVNAEPRADGNLDMSTSTGQMINAEYRVPMLAHTCMEPINATGYFTQGVLRIWAGNQAAVSMRNKCADETGLAPENVIVETPLMGGGFGRRGETDFGVLAARIAKMMPDVPVKVTWTREEDVRRDTYRPASIARFTGIVENGRAVMIDGQVAGSSVIQQSMKRSSGVARGGEDREHLSGTFDQPYQIPNFRMRGYLVPDDMPVGYWRAVGASHNGFYFDSFIDELAHAARQDPLEFRIAMAREEHVPSALVLEKVGELSGWTGATPVGVGRGVSFVYSYGTPVAQVVEVLDTDGGVKINKVWIACDPGVALDPRNIEAQMTGGCLFGLSAAVMGEITLTDGDFDQSNFHDYDALRMYNSPEFEVATLENNRHIGGVGEPGTPPAAAALANAIFDLTGIRRRQLPLNKEIEFI